MDKAKKNFSATAIATVTLAIFAICTFLWGSGILRDSGETKTNTITPAEKSAPSVQENIMPTGEVETPIPPQNKSTVQATGIAVARSDISNPSQRSYLMKKAAEADAKRKLAESIKGTLVEAETLVENGMVQSDSIAIRVKSILKSASIISSKELSDGSYEVIMEAPISQ